ncbi:hypothetical protein Q2T40_15575 [Winogradskyella maritima]|uniref:Toxin-antitoxin system YwqK family antitoxin n=1 Tax=Winogradskyella maritima TaxID=1517766 RepID=A0ABV8AFF7_9FLAO|nr:hypothetical protein [Winogradskyella maritima]
MRFFILFFFLCQLVSGQNAYQKNHDNNGNLLSEGWVNASNQKVKYWRFYHTNGQVKSEGHYEAGKKTKYWKFYRADASKEKEGHFENGTKAKWWLFYDSMGHINHKCQLKNNQKNGYCLRYEHEKLVRAEKYKEGKKINEWTDYRSFRKDNKLSDLR